MSLTSFFYRQGVGIEDSLNGHLAIVQKIAGPEPIHHALHFTGLVAVLPSFEIMNVAPRSQ